MSDRLQENLDWLGIMMETPTGEQPTFEQLLPFHRELKHKDNERAYVVEDEGLIIKPARDSYTWKLEVCVPSPENGNDDYILMNMKRLYERYKEDMPFGLKYIGYFKTENKFETVYCMLFYSEVNTYKI